jgi:hypothetical protein
MELTACVAGFLCWRKLKASYWKFFPVYLAIIAIAELLGRYLSVRKLYNVNFIMYNYFVIPLEILFFTWLFYKEFSNTRSKRLPVAAAWIYAACWLADMFIIPKGSYFWIDSFSYTVGILMLLVLILTALYKFVTSNELIFIKNNMMFWVCMGIFVFYSFSLPFYGIGNYLYNHYANIYLPYSQVVYVLNFIMYLLFTLAFIWGKPKLSFS